MSDTAKRPVFSAPLVALARAWPAILTVGAKWGGKVRCAADLALIDRLTPIAGGAAESGGVPFRDARLSGRSAPIRTKIITADAASEGRHTVVGDDHAAITTVKRQNGKQTLVERRIAIIGLEGEQIGDTT